MSDYNRPDNIPAMPTPPDPTEPRDSFVEKAINVWNWLKGSVSYFNNIVTWINNTVLPKAEAAVLAGNLVNYTGEHVEGNSYSPPTVVSKDGVFYQALQTTNTTPPSADWKHIMAGATEQIAVLSIQASVDAGKTNRIFEYTVEEEGFYSLFFSFTPDTTSDPSAPGVKSSFGTTYAYGQIYNGTAIGGEKKFSPGDIIYIDILGENNGQWTVYKSYLTLVKRI